MIQRLVLALEARMNPERALSGTQTAARPLCPARVATARPNTVRRSVAAHFKEIKPRSTQLFCKNSLRGGPGGARPSRFGKLSMRLRTQRELSTENVRKPVDKPTKNATSR